MLTTGRKYESLRTLAPHKTGFKDCWKGFTFATGTYILILKLQSADCSLGFRIHARIELVQATNIKPSIY